MKNVRVRLQTAPISCLQLTQFHRLWFMRVNRESLIDEEIPDLFPASARVERFVLCVADSAELFVCDWWLSSVRLTNKLNDPLTLINLLPQQFPEIPTLGSKNVLPDRLISEKDECIG